MPSGGRQASTVARVLGDSQPRGHPKLEFQSDFEGTSSAPTLCHHMELYDLRSLSEG